MGMYAVVAITVVLALLIAGAITADAEVLRPIIGGRALGWG